MLKRITVVAVLLTCACLLLAQSRRRIILQPASGIPGNGLVGMWIPALDFDARNLLAMSEAFDAAAWTRANIVVSADAAIAPDGTNTADSIADNDTNDTHRVYATTAIPASTSQVYTISVYALYSTHRWVLLRTSGTSPKGACFDIQNGLTGAASSGVTSGISPVGGGWYRLSMTVLAPITPLYPGIVLQNADSATAVSYVGTGTYSYFWGAQLNPGGLQPYVPTTDKQTLFDRSGYNLHGQLGATTGAEATDPAWQPDGLYYDGGDYVNLDAAGPVYGSAYTVLAVVTGAAQTATPVYAEHKTGTNAAMMALTTGATDSSKLRFRIFNDAGTAIVAIESSATAFDSAWHLVGLRDKGGAFSLFVDGNQTAGAWTQISLTLDGYTIAATRRAALIYFTGSIAAVLRWNRALSDSEYERVRRELRRMLAPAGVVIP